MSSLLFYISLISTWARFKTYGTKNIINALKVARRNQCDHIWYTLQLRWALKACGNNCLAKITHIFINVWKVVTKFWAECDMKTVGRRLATKIVICGGFNSAKRHRIGKLETSQKGLGILIFYSAIHGLFFVHFHAFRNSINLNHINWKNVDAAVLGIRTQCYIMVGVH